MATQQGGPPRGPWFRLATMARPPPPPPPSAPTPQPDQPPLQPRPSFIRPTFSTRVAPPPQPPPAPTAVPSPSPPSSPQPSLARTAPQAMSPSLKTTFSPSKTEQNSPRTVSRPPSPLALPSPQLKSNQPEYEQKTMLVQEPKVKTTSFDDGDLHRHMGSFLKKTESGNKHSESEDARIRIITIAGENKGAIMDLTPLSKNPTHKLGNVQKNNNYSDSSDGDKSESDSNGKSKAKNKNQKSKSPMMNAVMNSNVQGVNNSILYNSSTTHHDPGVHLSLSRNHSGGRGSQLKERIS